MQVKRIRSGIVFFAWTLLAPLTVSAQDWPKQRPVQFIVAFGPGSTTDLVGRLVELPDVKERLAKSGLTSKRNSPAEFAAFIREEIPKWAKAIKDSGARAD